MLQPSQAMDELFQSYEAIRQRLIGHVKIIATELEKPKARNKAIIVSNSALIDGILRDYQQYMVYVNQVRLSEEATATSQEELLGKRREWGAATARTNLFQVELNRWHPIKRLIEQQTSLKRKKLYADEEKLPPTTLAQMRASDDIFNWLHAAVNPSPQSEEARDKDCFPDIGLPNSDFHAHMHAAYRVCLAQQREGPIRFLDVGCGVGLKVYSAHRYFEDVSGIDLDPAYIKAAKKFFKMASGTSAHVQQADALTYNSYGDFDVIYFYRPISNDTLLMQLEQRIADHAKPGTILVAPYITFPSRHAALGCGHVDGAVYLANTSQRKAASVRRQAEMIGEYILEPKSAAPSSIWEPVIDASRSNGFDFPHRHKKARY